MSRQIKSIQPVNLLSFGPKTAEIELRNLNILIGPNGCGKSNFIEIIGFLKTLTEKEPWSRVTATGGHLEWAWKGPNKEQAYDAEFDAGIDVVCELVDEDLDEADSSYQLRLDPGGLRTRSPFAIRRESVGRSGISPENMKSEAEVLREDEEVTYPTDPRPASDVPSRPTTISQDLSLLSQRSWSRLLRGFKFTFARIALYRDWVFGTDSKLRALEQLGLENIYLEENANNLAHVLNHILTHESNMPGDKLRKAFRDFSNDSKDIETRIRDGYVQLRVRESSGVSTPAARLSDGTLRWLALLTILLNPTPPPVTCIEEPELGLHPDIIPTLAGLLRDASERTQLIVTTHSSLLVDAFSDMPESICVCEKVDGATQIQRLDRERLSSWLEDYSLGQLWAKGEIGGNRW
jgi:predicted ATPase